MSQTEKQSLPAGMLAAAGIVFGDIGTSPLYTLKSACRSCRMARSQPLP